MDNELAARAAVDETSRSDMSAASGPSHPSDPGEAKPAAKKRRRGRLLDSRYPIPPRELGGKWVAWSRCQIVASGETLAEVMQQVDSEKIKDASDELLPPSNVRS